MNYFNVSCPQDKERSPMVKKPRELPSDSKVLSSKKSPRDVAADEKKWSEIYHQQAKLRKEKEEVGLVKLP